jgi:hypothetical protein
MLAQGSWCAMGDRMARDDRGSAWVRKVGAVAGLLAVVAAGCSPHEESVQNPCPELSPRGAIALAKIGLTPRELKEQQRC